jgi:hypothetical protein
LYKSYIENGLLTKKTARKIRSEPSEAASLSGARALMDNLELYSNSDELVVQFVDTKYSDVAQYMAEKIPMSMISYLVGSEHWYAKQIVERRLMQQLEEQTGEAKV